MLYHYTNDEAKQKIVEEETHTVKFRFTRASQFTDKNECTYIIESYVHACGCLYDSGAISIFFLSLKIDRKSLQIKGFFSLVVHFGICGFRTRLKTQKSTNSRQGVVPSCRQKIGIR